jgi:DNA-repair protein complementing XP-A cells
MLIQKWGSLDDMDKEFYRRIAAKESRKTEKRKKAQAKLRVGVRTSDWKRTTEPSVHTHEFDNSGCCACGMVVEIEEF